MPDPTLLDTSEVELVDIKWLVRRQPSQPASQPASPPAARRSITADAPAGQPAAVGACAVRAALRCAARHPLPCAVQEEEPIVVVQFTCQQINCTRDSFGNVVDGKPDEVHRRVAGWW